MGHREHNVVQDAVSRYRKETAAVQPEHIMFVLKSVGEIMKTEDCEHDDINWDDEPDFCVTHCMSMYWFGECEDCGVRVRERFTSQGIEAVVGGWRRL